jgi:hypothetical protein
VRPTWIIFGWLMISTADLNTSPEIVAEKNNVCRSAGRIETIRRTLGQKPISSMRSASSSTSTSRASNRVLHVPM